MSTSGDSHRLELTRQKLVLSALLLVLALTIVGLGAFASFTSSSSASHTVATGTVTIALGATGAQTNRLTVNATGMAPAESIERSFVLCNSGSLIFASIILSSSVVAY